MLRFEQHPFNETTYEAVGDGKVRVMKPKTGTWGLFTFDGHWIEGEITQADPNMLRYVGGPDIPTDHDVFWPMAPAAYHDGTIAVNRFPGTHTDEIPRTPGRYQPDKGVETPEGMRSAGHLDMDFLLKNDRRPELIPKSFFLKNPLTDGPQRVDTRRFYSKEFHDLEVERLWKKTWQMVCRADDIPNVGDYHVYDIATLTYLVVRSAPDEIRAFQNVCLHRGRKLKECSGVKAKEFRCPYHSWQWNLDGSLKEIPTEWDFPGVRQDVAQLPQVKVGTWAGFVFINPDPNAGSLEDFLGPVMMDHYKKFNLQNRYKQAHVQKIVGSNWKVLQEGFMEAHHLAATHPQFVSISGDLANQRFDIFGNWGRCNHLGSFGSPQRGIVFKPEEILTFYRAVADAERERLQTLIGDEVNQYSDAELNDGGFHHLFPNINPWSGWTRICFRYRPHGDNPNECIMDIMLLAPWPEGKPKPPSAKLRKLGINDSWTLAPELLSLSKIVDQDVGNMAAMQAGLTAKQPPYVWYSAYQESIIRNFHRLYDNALGLTNGMPAA